MTEQSSFMEGGSSGISLYKQSVDKGVDKTTEGVTYIDVKIKCINGLIFFSDLDFFMNPKTFNIKIFVYVKCK